MHDLAEANAAPVRFGQSPISSCQGQQSPLKHFSCFLKRPRAGQSLLRDPLNHREQIVGSMLQLTDEYLLDFGRTLLFLLRALAFGYVEHGGQPARHGPAVVFFRRVDDMQESPAAGRVVNFSLEFDPMTLQDLFNVRSNRLKVLIAENVDQPLADDLLRSAAGQLQIGVTDEAVAQVAIQPDEHEWRSVNDALELGLLVAQDRLVFAQFFGNLLETVNVTRSQEEQTAHQTGAQSAGGKHRPALPASMCRQISRRWRCVHDVTAAAKIEFGSKQDRH